MSLIVENKTFTINRSVDETERKRAMGEGMLEIINSERQRVGEVRFFSLMKNNEKEKPNMLEREAWRFINNRRKDDAEYLKSLDSVSNQEERELLWKNYLREADQWEEECRRVINSERQRLHKDR
jgi:hypothetical protein